MVQLDFFHFEAAAPLGLIPQAVLEHTLGVLLANEELYRFRVVKLGERIQAHRIGPYSASRGEASVSRSRHRCLGGRAEARRWSHSQRCPLSNRASTRDSPPMRGLSAAVNA